MHVLICLLTFLVSTTGAVTHAASDPFAGITATRQHVAGSVHMIRGAGGNIVVSVGDDGTLMIDDDYAPMAERIMNQLEAIGGGRPKVLLNTHVHGDHVGGNPIFGSTGVIVAHENVRVRMLNADTPKASLPWLTYEGRLRLYFNGEQIDVFHLPAGHTDGDSVVWFEGTKVLHTGDLFFNGRFPFIDVGNGGSVDGALANMEYLLDHFPNDAKVVPGHGPLSDMAGLREAREVIVDTREQVRRATREGRIDALRQNGFHGPTQGWDRHERWLDTLLQADATTDDGAP